MGKTKTKIIDDSVVEEPKKVEEQPIETEAPAKKEAKADKEKVSKRAKKKAAATPKTHGKNYMSAREKVERVKRYSLNEAVKLAQEVSYSKFKGTVEAHLNTSAKNVRGLVTLPFAAGKKLTVLAFGEGADKSGADIVGNDEVITEIEKNKINFDVLVTTPAWMPKLSKLARVLGPKGLMPNPKNGTITDNLAKAVADLQAGKTEYKTEPNGQVIHLGVGKVDQNPEEICANIKALYNTIGRSKVKKLTLSPSMGPGVKVDLASI